MQFVTVRTQLYCDGILAMCGNVPQVMTLRNRIATGRACRHPFFIGGTAAAHELAILVRLLEIQPVFDDGTAFGRIFFVGKRFVKGGDNIFRQPLPIDVTDKSVQLLNPLLFVGHHLTPKRLNERTHNQSDVCALFYIMTYKR